MPNKPNDTEHTIVFDEEKGVLKIQCEHHTILIDKSHPTLNTLLAQREAEARIDEIALLAKEGKRVGGFGSVPNLQNYLKLRLKELKDE